MNENIDQLRKLALLREPFPASQISRLPRQTKGQKEALEKNPRLGIKCNICGGWHHQDAIHLDYVGHATLTNRLLDVDPLWSWEPLAYKDGLPAFDSNGGLWIKLTVCGLTRLGYGNAEDKSYMDIGAREKEVIGDALRNAAMRFGAALELWSKVELSIDAITGKDGDKKTSNLSKSDNDTGEVITGRKPSVAMPQKKSMAENVNNSLATVGEIAFITKKLNAKGLTIATAREQAGLESSDTLDGLTKDGFIALKDLVK